LIAQTMIYEAKLIQKEQENHYEKGK